MISSRWNNLVLPLFKTTEGAAADIAGGPLRPGAVRPGPVSTSFVSAAVAAALSVGVCAPVCASRPAAGAGPAVIRSLTVGHSGSTVSLALEGDRLLQAHISRNSMSGFLNVDVAGRPLFRPSRTHIGIGGIDVVRSGWYSSRPPALRVIVEGNDNLHYQLQRHNKMLTVLLWSGSGAPSGSYFTGPPPARKSTHTAVSNASGAPAVVKLARTTPTSAAKSATPAARPGAPVMSSHLPAAVPAAPAAATARPVLAAAVPSAPPAPVFVAAARFTPRVSRANRGLVQLNLKGASLVDVLKALADQTGTNIVIASGVSGTVTIDLRNVTVDTALDLITKLNNLSYRRKNDTIVVGTEAQIKEMFDNHVGPIIVPINQGVAADVVAAITKNYPDVQVNAEGPSQIVLSGPSSDVQEAQKLVNGLQGAPVATAAATPVLITLQVARPADVIATLTKLYTHLQVFPQGPRQVLVTGDPADVASAVALIKGIDIPGAQMPGVETVTYESRYANVYDLVRILAQQVPQVTATAGPGPQFSGASGSSGSSGSMGASGAGMSSAGSGSSAGGASGTSSEASSSGGGASSSGASGGGASSGSGGVSGASGGVGGASGGSSGSPLTSILLLTGTQDAIATARTVLTSVDVPKASMRIEARVIDVNLDHTSTTGITWSFSQGFSFGEISPPATSPLGIFPFKGGPLSRPNISATLDLLANDSHNKVLASPTVTAVSDEPSSIFIGDEITYVSNVDRATNGAGTFNTSKVDVGITLNAVGHVNPDGTITLSIAPNVSVLTALAAGANGAQLPLIAQRRAQTVMRVRSGQTIAIGGLIRDEDLAAMQKVPILSNLPVLGELFRHRSITHHRSEVVIFLRATTLGVDGSMPDAEAPLPDSPTAGGALSGAPVTGGASSVPPPSSPI